jgi:triphosphoribosyl-dephospho-CoA synthetase
MAVRALLREAEAGPKPGLVDRFGPGVHTDMDISHFRLSAALGHSLRPYFESAIILEAALPTDALAETLRTLGLQAEAAMLAATGGVNTHKGAIWTIGLLCAAVGLSIGLKTHVASCAGIAIVPASFEHAGGSITAEELCSQAARIAHAILSSGMEASPVVTKGMAARQDHGLRSARDEAISGFPSIMARALPCSIPAALSPE